MEVEEVFKVISFSQKPFMKEWVDFCTSKRKNAKMILREIFGN